ncbi:MAG: hypothetical protein ACI9AF_001181, partial [Granulosicoccus sp.]
TEDNVLSPVLSDTEKFEGPITIHALVIEKDAIETKALKKKEAPVVKS